MDALLDVLETHRRRIRARRALESAARWALYAALAGVLVAGLRKFLGAPVPAAWAAAPLLAAPAGMALRAWARGFSLRDCAIHLDRLLGLEERLSTALEGAGSFSLPLRADAEGALARAPVPLPPMPLEARLLAPAFVLLGAILAIPAPERGVKLDPGAEAVLAAEALTLERLAAADVRFREAAELLAQGRPEEAFAALQALRESLERKLLEADASGAEALRRQAEQAAASAAAVAAELARQGRMLHAPAPRIAEAKLQRQRREAAVAAAAEALAAPALEAVLSSRDWDSRYDPVIRRYFGSGP
jgi:hypothetical protein